MGVNNVSESVRSLSGFQAHAGNGHAFWRRRETVVFALLIGETALFGMVCPGFFRIDNFITIIQNSVDVAVVAAGVTLAVVAGGIDVSVGSLSGVVAIIASWMLMDGRGFLPTLLVAMLTGALVGSVNGVIIAYGKVPPIIATLGTDNILRALIFAMLGGRWITDLPPTLDFLNGRIWGWLPVPAVVIAAVYLLFWYFTRHRILGRHIYAVGNNAEASRLAGINTSRVLVGLHMIIGALAGVAALSYLARMGSVEVTVGSTLGLQALAATVVGGTSVTGGRGSVIGTLIGVLFINVLQNGILLLGVPSLMEWAIIGLFMIVSVSLDLLWGSSRPR